MVVGGNGESAKDNLKPEGPKLVITLDPQTRMVNVNSNTPDDIVLLGMLEKAKAVIIDSVRQAASAAPRIAIPPPGLKV
jgi:hypothetical protein